MCNCYKKSYENVKTNNGDQGFHVKVMLKEKWKSRIFLGKNDEMRLKMLDIRFFSL